MHSHPSRREWLTRSASAVVAASAAPALLAAEDKPAADPFVYCLNTSTIMGQKLSLVDEIDLAAKAGYGALEPWVRELEAHVKSGGTLKDVAKRLRDHGMVVPDVIDFFPWVVDDEAARKKGLEQAKRGMDLGQQIGAVRVAAPPVGATDQTDLNLLKAAERYRALLDVGDKIGVIPQVEVWGFSKSLSRLGECALVALESGHPKACVLADVYHLYKGGSGARGLKLLGPDAVHVLHMNDYPAAPPRDKITDAQRIYPGDGVAPLTEILRDLSRPGFRVALSLELFNRDYWTKDPMVVIRNGLEKMRAAVRAAGR